MSPLERVEMTAQTSMFEQGERVQKEGAPRSLRDDFIVPAFSYLNRQAVEWTDRRRGWLSRGIKSELGRGENLLGMSDTIRRETSDTGTSVFDPVLCELAYRWFCKRPGIVLDPFAGGSVRGVVAAAVGHPYVGIELRPEQVTANRREAGHLFGPDGPSFGFDVPIVMPRWIEGSSANLLEMIDGPCDLVFSCPPYADLEQYSDDPADLSNMPWPLFLAGYRWIIAQAVHALSKDRFAAFVVGDVREKTPSGFYRDLIGETIRAFEDAGARLYNNAIVGGSAGSAALRAGRQMDASRKLVTIHQHLLVFVKGEGRAAARWAAA